MAKLTLTQQIADIQGMISSRLGHRGATLAEQVDKAQRDLPRRLRRDAAYLVQAEGVAYHPRLQQLVDPRKATAAYAALAHYLGRVQKGDRWKRKAVNILASISFVVIVVFVAVIWAMVDRGIL